MQAGIKEVETVRLDFKLGIDRNRAKAARSSEHRLAACEPSGSVNRLLPDSAECNSAGRTDQEVYVPTSSSVI